MRSVKQQEANLAIDFPRSDLMLDPAALRGPDAARNAAGAGLDTVIDQAAVARFGESGGPEAFATGVHKTSCRREEWSHTPKGSSERAIMQCPAATNELTGLAPLQPGGFRH